MSDYLDGEDLPLGVRFVVRFHLTICPPCRRTRRALEATQDALRGLRDADVAVDPADDSGAGNAPERK